MIQTHSHALSRIILEIIDKFRSNLFCDWSMKNYCFMVGFITS